MTKILIVEDDKSILMSLAMRMRAQGYEVVTAQDGMMALTVAVKEKPQLAILDISMPAGNGFTVAERLQDNIHTSGIPMIFMTASSKPELREEAMAHGAIAFFEKPFEPDELMRMVASALGLAA